MNAGLLVIDRELSEVLVSVVITTFNRQELLGKALRSVQSQSYQNLEIIVVDDYSDDDTPSIVAEFMRHDPRIVYLRTPNQSGRPSIPRNLAIAQAKGKYIAFLDDDDYWRRKKIEVQIRALGKDENFSMVFSPIWQFRNKNYLLGAFLLRPPTNDVRKELMKGRNPIQFSSVVIATSAARQLDGFNESKDLRSIEDYEFWIRVSMNYEILELYKVLGFYGLTPGSLTQQEVLDARTASLKILYPNIQTIKKQNLIQRVVFRISVFPGILKNIRF